MKREAKCRSYFLLKCMHSLDLEIFVLRFTRLFLGLTAPILEYKKRERIASICFLKL